MTTTTTSTNYDISFVGESALFLLYEELLKRHNDILVICAYFTATPCTLYNVKLAGLPAPPTSHTFQLYPFHPSPTFPLPNYTAGDLEIPPDFS